MTQTALIIVDMQMDFITGSMAVPGAEELVDALVDAAYAYPVRVATLDWHPYEHVSFKTHGGEFPRHCVGGTEGSKLHPKIEALNPIKSYKGLKAEDSPAMDGFEGKVGNMVPLARWLNSCNVDTIVVGGLTGEFCVAETALGGVREGFSVSAPDELTRSLSADSRALAVERMRQAGVVV